MRLSFRGVLEGDDGRNPFELHPFEPKNNPWLHCNRQRNPRPRCVPRGDYQVVVWNNETPHPPIVHRTRLHGPHLGALNLPQRELLVQEAENMTQILRNWLLLVPFVRGFWAADKLVEPHKERPNPLHTPHLVLCLAPQLCHPPRRASEQLHDLPQESHELIPL